MNYWIDVENGEYGMVEKSTNLPGLMVTGEGPVESPQTERMAAQAREMGGVLVMEEMETFQAVFGALESALAMSFIHSPVAPTVTVDQSPPTETPAIQVLTSAPPAMQQAA